MTHIKYFFLGLLIFSCVGFFNTANADAFSQPLQNVTATANSHFFAGQALPLGLSGAMTSFRVKLNVLDTSNATAVFFLQRTGASVGGSCTPAGQIMTGMSWSYAPTSTGIQYAEFKLSQGYPNVCFGSNGTTAPTSTWNLDPSDGYSIVFNTGADQYVYYGTDVPNGAYMTPWSMSNASMTQLYYQSYPSVPVGSTLTWINPTNGTTTTQPPTWDLTLSNASGSDGIVAINYGSAYPNTYQDFQVYLGALSTTSTNQINILRTTPLADARFNTSWTAEADYYDNTTYPIPTSSIPIASTTITFSVLPLTSTPSSTPPVGTSTPVVTCDSTTGFFQNSFCNLGLFLFYPSNGSINKFAGLKSMFANKPPFGYYTSFSNAISGLQNGTTSVQLMSASSSAAFSPVFSPLRDGLSWLFWFLFVFWGIHKFRTIEL